MSNDSGFGSTRQKKMVLGSTAAATAVALVLYGVAQFASYTEWTGIDTPAANPDAGKIFVYAKADGNIYRKDSGGNELNGVGPPTLTLGQTDILKWGNGVGGWDAGFALDGDLGILKPLSGTGDVTEADTGHMLFRRIYFENEGSAPVTVGEFRRFGYNLFMNGISLSTDVNGINSEFFGKGAGQANTSGENNTFIGHNAGQSNITAGYGVFIGKDAGIGNSGNSNVFIGVDSGVSASGAQNTACGSSTLNNLSTGYQNAVFGNSAGIAIDSGHSNSLFGASAGAGITEGQFNIAIGFEAGFFIDTGDYNIMIGKNSGVVLDSGLRNIGIGTTAFVGLMGGNDNISIGQDNGSDIVNGNNNILLGNSVGGDVNNDISDHLLIGGPLGNQITTGIFGNGFSSETPDPFTLQSSNGRGTNITALALNIAGGRGTGTGLGGSVVIQTAPAGASSSTLNDLVTRVTVDATGSTTFGLASNTAGIIKFANATNGNLTTFQSGVATGAVTYTLPTAAPAADHLALLSATEGTMRWGGAPGGFIQTTTKTTGTTFTTTANTRKIRVRVQAGGGGGGGSDTGAVSAGVGGGGSAGGYAEKTFDVEPSTGYTYAIGAAGAGGTAGPNDGSAGGNSTFQVGATTVTSFGGLGGVGGAAGTVIGSSLGGASPAISTNGDVNAGGCPGDYGTRLTGTSAVSGKGGSCLFGGGGNSVNTEAVGNAGVGFGAGGGGGTTLNGGTARAGGAGLAGIIVVDEFY